MRKSVARFTMGGVMFAAIATATGVSLMGSASAVDCRPVNHGDLDGIATIPAAAVELTGDGVKISTPDIPAKATWRRTVSPIDGDTFVGASYTLTKIDPNTDPTNVALPAFHIYARVGGNLGTLVFEPYWNEPVVRNLERPWLINRTTSRFWTNSTAFNLLQKSSGGPGDGQTEAETLQTWDTINGNNPTLEIVGYGWGQGTYNAGAVSLLNDLKLQTSRFCGVDRWSTRFMPKPSQSSSKSASASASSSSSSKPPTSSSSSASASASASASTSVSASASASASSSAPTTLPTPPDTDPPVGGGSDLPLTGTPVSLIVGSGLGLVLIGGAALLLLRRRRAQFSA